jgi:hypothetical protein
MKLVKTVENLQQVANSAGEYSLTEAQRNELLSIYNEKKAELTQVVVQDVVPVKSETVSDIEEDEMVETPN